MISTESLQRTDQVDSRDRLHVLVAAVLPALLLLPFVNKAYHLDDPFYLWVGQHIAESPLDFYGFTLNWEDVEQPAWEVNKNPPLVSYYMALVGSLFGWSERVLHMAFLLPAMGVGLGTYLLARRLTVLPLVATLVAVFSPLFLVSASNVMAEVTMLAFYVWAVYWWVAGLQDRKAWMLGVSGVCIALSALSKYFGVSLFPLLIAYAVFKRAPIRQWAPWLAIPVTCLVLYEVYTYRMYGQGLLWGTVSFSQEYVRVKHAYFEHALTGLSFVGGGMIPVLLLGPLLWSWRYGVVYVTLAVLTFWYASMQEYLYIAPMRVEAAVRLPILVQYALFVPAGLFVLLLPILDVWRRRSADAALLALWVFGTLLFALTVNWTINGRGLIALAVPAGILVARRLTDFGVIATSRRAWAPYLALVPGALLAVIVVYADTISANAVRRAAQEITTRRPLPPFPGQLWYFGHWGFQYYMEQGDAKSIDRGQVYLVKGDAIVAPRNNVQGQLFNDFYQHTFELEYEVVPFVSAWNHDVGAGFYAAGWGPLPFAFGRVKPDKYKVMLVSRTSYVSVPQDKGTRHAPAPNP